MRPEGLVISPHEGDSPRWTEMGSHVISPSDEKVPCGFLGNTSRHTGVGEEDDTSQMSHTRCQEAFNKRLPVYCFGSVRNPLALIDS